MKFKNYSTRMLDSSCTGQSLASIKTSESQIYWNANIASFKPVECQQTYDGQLELESETLQGQSRIPCFEEEARDAGAASLPWIARRCISGMRVLVHVSRFELLRPMALLRVMFVRAQLTLLQESLCKSYLLKFVFFSVLFENNVTITYTNIKASI